MLSKRFLIFGNSGSGKSTLASALAASKGIAHLDLDTLAWLPTTPPQRAPLQDVEGELRNFVQSHSAEESGWVVEGCYSDLLALLSADADHILFLNLPVDACIENAKARPWESHKYASKTAQDANLAMLLTWIGQYTHRGDEFSFSAHQQFYDAFTRRKTMISENMHFDRVLDGLINGCAG
ncbi:Uncharacterised protein [Zhongshania aliphaticivorans]|uniref:Shikimate kinase n=1 Tax=Zhongshania aliphaticivorans TaxID=1470434 RepID=A0A5S9NM59_9GAMM|nr:AAA family ATPase [Zhongshania aliphaticivorans]CAA0091670.1 Uncharacterised protein [Zhongshania aliphaticivorans]CAA0099027.1 Uncharacterised protein [Zhongshania aliphaticivorans]